jgi:hypothetical protein
MFIATRCHSIPLPPQDTHCGPRVNTFFPQGRRAAVAPCDLRCCWQEDFERCVRAEPIAKIFLFDRRFGAREGFEKRLVTPHHFGQRE